MEWRDYLMRQFDQVGQVLGKILSDLLGLKSQGKVNDGIEIVNQVLKEELDLDIQKLLNIQLGDFINTLKTEKGFTNESLDKLADILTIIADNRQNKDKKMLYERCLIIYEYLEKTESVYSLDRKWKIEQIKNML